MPSAKQGSYGYHFLKSFGMTRQGDLTREYGFKNQINGCIRLYVYIYIHKCISLYNIVTSIFTFIVMQEARDAIFTLHYKVHYDILYVGLYRVNT